MPPPNRNRRRPGDPAKGPPRPKRPFAKRSSEERSRGAGSGGQRTRYDGNQRATPQRQGPEGPRTAPSRTLAEEIRASARPAQADRALRAFQEAVGLLERGREAAALGPA